ncbi:hypothetical protein GCM10027073_30170 [Streptomyces chlorus]|uniref:Uncharacterized protein n=1 Tax=Streptomyces chlorus TaxID=887452 RepID=A0ABW1E4S7_9ACTN
MGHGVAAEPAELQGLLETATPGQARKAVRELALIADKGTAMQPAARFSPVADLASEELLRLRPKAADPDGFSTAHRHRPFSGKAGPSCDCVS